MSSTNTISATAIQMLTLDSSLMPLSRPRATEIDATTMIAAMSSSWISDVSGSPSTREAPELICMAPMPTDTAMPKTVPMMATESMSLPGQA